MIQGGKSGERVHRFHIVPLSTENFANFPGAHGLVLGGNLWSPSASENHESIHGPFRRSICVQGLRNEGRIVVCTALRYFLILSGASGGTYHRRARRQSRSYGCLNNPSSSSSHPRANARKRAHQSGVYNCHCAKPNKNRRRPRRRMKRRLGGGNMEGDCSSLEGFNREGRRWRVEEWLTGNAK
jgi:hypothetical protein